MAAHIITAFDQLHKEAMEILRGERDLGKYYEHLEHALNFAPWANLLVFSDWIALHKLTQSGDVLEIKNKIEKLLPFYENEWLTLRKPKTYEEWRNNL